MKNREEDHVIHGNGWLRKLLEVVRMLCVSRHLGRNLPDWDWPELCWCRREKRNGPQKAFYVESLKWNSWGETGISDSWIVCCNL